MSDGNQEQVTPAAETPAADESTQTGTVLTQDDSATTPNSEAADTRKESTDTPDPELKADEGSLTAPDTYADFAMPEGVTVDDAMLKEATPLFKELGLTQEQAQKLVDFQAKQVEASSQSQTDSFNQLMNEWQEQSRNDKEFGGDKFEENVSIARSAIDKFGTPELKQLLEDHGVGNHPEVIRFMINVGKTTQEDVPGGSSNPTSKAQDTVSLLYPNDRNA